MRFFASILFPLCSLTVLLVGSSTTAQAQTRPTGYVVTLAGDTVRGTVRQAGPTAITLRRPEGVTNYTPAQARAFAFSPDEAYESRLVRTAGGTEAPQFVRLLVPGPAQLFTGQAAEAPYHFYLQNAASPLLYELTANNWQLVMTQQLPVCPGFSVSSQATSTFGFDARNLKRVVAAYNHCVQPQAPTPELESKSSGQASWGFTAGLDGSTYHYDNHLLKDAPSPRRLGYRAGVYSALTTPRGLLLRAELLLQQQQGTVGPIPEYTGTSVYSGNRQSELEFTSIQLHALVGKAFGQGKCQPFVRGGLSAAAYLRRRGTETLAYTAGGPQGQVAEVDFASSIGGGLVGGAGVLLPLTDGHSLEMEARYGLGFADFSSTGSLQYNTIALQASIGF
jgi:hypothetical protein